MPIQYLEYIGLIGFVAGYFFLPMIGKMFRLHMAYIGVLRAYPALEQHPRRHRLLRSRDGIALLALLCNAAAKRNSALYRHKLTLIRATVARSGRSEWWIDPHRFDEGYPVAYGIFIETTIGPICDLDRVQVVFHITEADARFFRNAPTTNGRTWAGIPLQGRAEEIARAFLEQQKGRNNANN